ncbi:MAG: protein of unknown function (DUF4389) [Chloroflexi bacterium]|nr:MAG: protein of unknown function (DUF4389) [Chloroflexota bacterium]
MSTTTLNGGYPILVRMPPRPERFERSGLALRIIATLLIGWTGVGAVIYALPLVTAVLTWQLKPGQSFAERYGESSNKLIGLWVGFETWRMFGTEEMPDWNNPDLSRLTIAYDTPTVAGALARYLLIIPHVIFYWILSMIVTLAFIVVFFTVLFSESVPGGIQGFYRGMIAYQARTVGYYAGLVGTYPPFSVAEPDSPHPTETP